MGRLIIADLREEAPHRPPPAVRSTIAGRCPRCGEGRLFSGFLEIAATCGHCGLDLRAHDSGDGPAVIVLFVLGFLVVPLALLLESLAEPPYWVHLTVWPPVILGLALGMLRPIKGFFVGQQYRHRSTAQGGGP